MTAGEFGAWLSGAAISSTLTYHHGDLANDREHNDGLDDLASAALMAFGTQRCAPGPTPTRPWSLFLRRRQMRTEAGCPAAALLLWPTQHRNSESGITRK